MNNLHTFKTILITGANRGIGLEFVKQYSSEADKIFACCRTPENALELAQLAQTSDNIELIPLDVINHMQVDALRQRLTGHKLDLLINNAGVFPEPRNTLNKEDWLNAFAINSWAPNHLVETLKDILNDSIVANITSRMGSIGDNSSGGASGYRASKAALNAAMRSFALDNADNIITLLIHPGWVQTDMGGPNAHISVVKSVTGMRTVIASADYKMNGQFFDYAGSIIPW